MGINGCPSNGQGPGARGTSAPESKYGLNYDYVRLFDRDMGRFHNVRQETAAEINKQIQQASVSMSLQSTMFGASAMAAGYSQWQNQFVLENENINPNDGVPSYVSAMMYDGPGGSEAEYKAKEDGIQSEFYDTVYYCDSVLTPVTRNVLGADYRAYAAQRREAENQLP